MLKVASDRRITDCTISAAGSAAAAAPVSADRTMCGVGLWQPAQARAPSLQRAKESTQMGLVVKLSDRKRRGVPPPLTAPAWANLPPLLATAPVTGRTAVLRWGPRTVSLQLAGEVVSLYSEAQQRFVRLDVAGRERAASRISGANLPEHWYWEAFRLRGVGNARCTSSAFSIACTLMFSM